MIINNETIIIIIIAIVFFPPAGSADLTVRASKPKGGQNRHRRSGLHPVRGSGGQEPGCRPYLACLQTPGLRGCRPARRGAAARCTGLPLAPKAWQTPRQVSSCQGLGQPQHQMAAAWGARKRAWATQRPGQLAQGGVHPPRRLGHAIRFFSKNVF